jgi:Barstar (barnase inhibitor)
MNADWLKDAAKAGVYHLTADAREFAAAAAAAGLAVARVDIGHAHGKEDFAALAAQAMNFPEARAADWTAFTGGLEDLAWLPAVGWVLILEKSRHFHGHGHEFADALAAMDGAAVHWRAQGKPFWTLIGGPDGWKSGWPDMPAA